MTAIPTSEGRERPVPLKQRDSPLYDAKKHILLKKTKKMNVNYYFPSQNSDNPALHDSVYCGFYYTPHFGGLCPGFTLRP